MPDVSKIHKDVFKSQIFRETRILRPLGTMHAMSDSDSDNGSDNTDSQVVLGVANVHEDAVLL